MTTQARELAKLVSNAGDVNLGDDISLASDGAVLNFGADSDVTLTHVADTGLLLNSSRQIQFGDSGTHIRQSADGVLNITSDTEVEINATTVDINANVDISGNLVLGGNITIGDADSDDISFAGELTSHIVPNATNTYDLGSASKEWRNAFFDGTVTSDAFAGPLTGDVTGNVTGNASGTAATVTGAAQTNITSLGTLTGLTGGTGDLVWDSPTFVVDSSENKVGIGTASPDEILHLFDGGTDTKIKVQSKVAADATASILLMSRLADNSNKNVTLQAYRGNLSVTSDFGYGKVGIGNTTPTTFLDVGIAGADATAVDANIRLNTHYGTQNTSRGGIQWYDGSDETGQIDTRYDGTSVDMHFGSLYNSGYNTTSRMVIKGNGDVGIGTTSPSKKLAISNGGAQGIEISPAESGVSRIFSYNRSSNAYTPLNIQGEYIMFGTGTSNAERVRINAEGIAFNGDSAAANSLDDYEEGAWTPSLFGANTTINDAHYVKIGSLVYINTYITFNSLPNDGQIFKITGLPYATQPNSTYGGGSISYSHAANTADMQPLTQTGDSYIYFHETDGTSATVTRTTAYSRFANGAGYLLLNMTYMTGF